MLGWGRHSASAYWCAIVEVDDSIHTACRGRWPVQDQYAHNMNPPARERCGGCVRAQMQASLRELAQAQTDVSRRMREALDAYSAASAAFVEFMIAEALRLSARADAFPDEREWLGGQE